MNFFYRNTLFLSDFSMQLRENKLTVETNNSKANSFLLEHLSCLSYVSFFCGKILSTELAQKLFSFNFEYDQQFYNVKLNLCQLDL